MRAAYHRRRLIDFAAGLRLSRVLIRDQYRPRPELGRLRQERLDAIVHHAVARSRFYRDRLFGLVGDGPVALETLPVLTKAEMMEHYDELVTDPRLKREELLGWITRAESDDYFLEEYRVMTTSGSSGRKGLFVYDRAAWRWVVAMFLRQSQMMGIAPRVPRWRIAAVHGTAQAHMSRQITTSVAVGVHRVTTLPVTMPIERLVKELNAFRPDWLTGYPSVVARLAEEQLGGRLRVSLAGVSTSSELRTPEVTGRIREAFGVEPFDIYATTEGLWGGECERHDGIHVFEDVTLVENVDAENKPVPVGEPGAKVLVTSLVNGVQPIIRLEVTDVMVLDDEPCACGRTLTRAAAIEGRSDDVLEFPASHGGEVRVHPLQFSFLTRDREVGEFQVVQEGRRLRVLVVPRRTASHELERRLGRMTSERLAELGAGETEVVVERCDRLRRPASGKLQMVVADPSARQKEPGHSKPGAAPGRDRADPTRHTRIT